MKTTPALIFLHIPKTAGTSFHTALSWQYWGKPSYWIDPLDLQAERFRQMPMQLRADMRLLRGHMEFGLHQFLPKPAVYATFIREPVARLISYWQNQQNEARLHPTLTGAWLDAARSMTLEQYIASSGDTNLDNDQVRRISGIKVPFGDCSRPMLEKARSNITQYFPMVGLTERFDESLVLMRNAFNWKRPLLYQAAKVHGMRQGCAIPSATTMNDIRRLNELDMELHAFAKDKFESQVKASNSRLEEDVKRLQRLTRVWSWFIPFARRLAGRKA